ncbi:MAG TPA: DUF1800 family protein, partial [Blastocatellia bacterium]|nr:DUF1800 family protein [Blastocatellia bacterium]
MRLTARQSVTTILAIVMLASLAAPAGLAQQGSLTPNPRPLTPIAQGALERLLEPYVVRLRNQLTLDQDQVTQVRKLLWAHSEKLTDLRNRSQAQPYSAQLAADLGLEQRALREEILTFLTEDQKSRLGQVDFRLPIAPPAFILINIPRRATSPDAPKLLAPVEPLLPAVATPAKGRPARLTEDQKLLHLLNRLTFGPRPGDLERLRQIGGDKFIDEQLHPETIDDSDLETRLSVLPTLRMASQELYQFYPPAQVVDQRAKERNPPPVFGTPRQVLGEMAQQKLVRTVSSNRQLQEVMTDFWFNHFNVFAQSQWLLTGYERDVIRPRALGRFRDLLAGVAASPAMLVYLDNWLSAAPDSRQPRPPSPRPANLRPNTSPDAAKPAAGANSTSQPGAMGTEQKPAMQGQPAPQPPRPPARKPGINENYARELLELHTMGVDGGYTQKDVQEIARCFTGWTV